MNTGAYIGIDPGKKGAAALWDRTGNELRVYDFTNYDQAVEKLREWKELFIIRLVALEMPNVPPKFSSSASGKLMRNAGVWEGALIAFDIDYIPIAPNQWKRIIPPGKSSVKMRAINHCRRTFPGCESLIVGLKHNDRAEAMLLAHYAFEWDRLRP